MCNYCHSTKYVEEDLVISEGLQLLQAKDAKGCQMRCNFLFKRIRSLALLLPILMLMLSATGAYAQDVFHVRAGATGTNDGSNWNNAFPSLPSALMRGTTYYIAGGDYPAYIFDDAIDGTSEITLKKAIATAHGSDIGWQDSFGSRQAVFGPLNFSTGYYIFDGVTGGGPSNWSNGFGFRITSSDVNYTMFTYFKNGGSHIRIAHTDIGLTSQPNPGCDCAAYSAQGADDVTFSYCYIHHFGDVGFTLLDADGWTIEYSKLDRLSRYGSKDGICGTLGQINHGAGLELTNKTTNLTIKHNWFSNIEGTGWIGIYGGDVDGMKITGNVFENSSDYTGLWGNGIIYNTSSGTSAVRNVHVYNNTFRNLNYSTVLGLSVDSGGNEFINNIIYNVKGVPSYQGFIRSHNASDQKVPGDIQLQLLTSDPFINSAPGEFRLKGNTDSGEILPQDFSTDLLGTTRSADGIWDRGAVEFNASYLASPTGLHIIK